MELTENDLANSSAFTSEEVFIEPSFTESGGKEVAEVVVHVQDLISHELGKLLFGLINHFVVSVSWFIGLSIWLKREALASCREDGTKVNQKEAA